MQRKVGDFDTAWREACKPTAITFTSLLISSDVTEIIAFWTISEWRIQVNIAIGEYNIHL